VFGGEGVGDELGKEEERRREKERDMRRRRARRVVLRCCEREQLCVLLGMEEPGERRVRMGWGTGAEGASGGRAWSTLSS
jgi:hypothetical protein